MKRLIKNSLLCFVSLAIWSTNDCVAQRLKDYGLVGKVKSIREYHYEPLYDCDYCEELQCDSTVVYFDANGKELKNIFYTCSFLESEKGKVFKEIKNYKYNTNGELEEMQETDAVGTVSYKKYIRDDRGYTIRIEKQNSTRQIWSTEYLNRGEDGTLKESTVYDYFNSKRTLSRREFFDEKGFLTKRIDYDLEGNKRFEDTFIRERYSTGITAKRTIVSSGGNINKEVEIYNEKGLITSLTRYFKLGGFSCTTYTYTYDNHGNWVTQKIEKPRGEGKEIDIYKRKITYYK